MRILKMVGVFSLSCALWSSQGFAHAHQITCQLGPSTLTLSQDQFPKFQKNITERLHSGGFEEFVAALIEISVRAGAFNGEGSVIALDSSVEPVAFTGKMLFPDIKKLEGVDEETLIGKLTDFEAFQSLVRVYGMLPKMSKLIEVSCESRVSKQGIITYACAKVSGQEIAISISYSRENQKGSFVIRSGAQTLIENEISCKSI